MSGLNEGLEIGEELNEIEGDALHVLFDHTTPGDHPDIDEDVSVVTAVTDRVNQLDHLYSDITQSEGMDKTFALECENLMEGFLGPDRPLGYFTEHPSRTLLTVSLEEIETQQKTLLQRIGEAFSKMLAKIAEWLRGLFRSRSEGKAKADLEKASKYYKDKPEETKADLLAMQQAYENPKSAVDRVSRLAKDTTSNEFRDYIQALEEKLTEGTGRLDNLYGQINKNDLLYHLVVGSEYIDKIMKVGKNVGVIVQALYALDEKAMKEFTELDQDPLALELKSKATQKVLRDLASVYGAPTFNELYLQLRSALPDRNARVEPKTHSMANIYARLRGLYDGYSPDQFNKAMSQTADVLDGLRKNMDEIVAKTRLSPKERQKNNYGFVTELFKQIYAEIRGLSKMVEMANDLFFIWSLLAKMLESYTHDFHNRVKGYLSKLDESSRKLISEYFSFAYMAVDMK